MKILAKFAFSIFSSALLLGVAAPAFAATPVLSVSSQGNSNVQVIVNADPYSQITLYRRQVTQLWTVISNFGQTNASGYYSTSMGLGSNGSNNVVEQYVVVNGQQSSIVQTYPSGYNGSCTYNCGSPTGLSLSQNSLSLNVGQSATVTAYNASGVLYVSNTTASVSGYSNNGNQISVYASAVGSANLNICSSNGCATLYVTVTGNSCNSYNCNGSLTFSPSNVSVSSGQSSTVYISGTEFGSGSYYVSTNSNSTVLTSSISGSVLTVSGSQTGTGSVTVCQYNTSSCGTVQVTVNGSNSNGLVWFNVNNPQLSAGQTMVVNVSSSNGSNYYISNNTNSNAVSASLSGSAMTLYGSNSGNSNITVCSSNGSYCGTLYATVSGYNNTQVSITNTSIPAMTLGQYYSYQLQATGGASPYTFSVNSGNLPAGLYLSNSGLLYGTAQTAQSAGFAVRASDAYGRVGYTQVFINGYGVNNGVVLGASTNGANGQLVNENGTVYIVYKNSKTAFGNAAAFTGLGFNFNNVLNVGSSGIINSGYIVSTANAAHPWGAWLKSGSTVYFVHELGLIPVGDYSTFLNNGGTDYLVVQANSYDFQRPILSVMTTNDARLR